MKLLRLAPENTKFGFMRFRRVSYPLSAALSIISVLAFLFIGMNFGIDFSGGTQVQLRSKSGPADIAQLRKTAESLGLGQVEVQRIGADTAVLSGQKAVRTVELTVPAAKLDCTRHFSPDRLPISQISRACRRARAGSQSGHQTAARYPGAAAFAACRNRAPRR